MQCSRSNDMVLVWNSSMATHVYGVARSMHCCWHVIVVDAREKPTSAYEGHVVGIRCTVYRVKAVAVHWRRDLRC